MTVVGNLMYWEIIDPNPNNMWATMDRLAKDIWSETTIKQDGKTHCLLGNKKSQNSQIDSTKIIRAIDNTRNLAGKKPDPTKILKQPCCDRTDMLDYGCRFRPQYYVYKYFVIVRGIVREESPDDIKLFCPFCNSPHNYGRTAKEQKQSFLLRKPHCNKAPYGITFCVVP